ncbi:MAG: HAMP domain-containing sensor histidine kinase [Lagierella massiliensis]|nr:HAMP domain-containing sensor histidine kinase [Lagierella massiliensis]
MDEKNKSYKNVLIKRTGVTILITLISILFGFIIYNNYGKLNKNQMIPFYMENKFKYGKTSLDNYGEDLIDFHFKYGEYFESDAVGNPINKDTQTNDEKKPQDNLVISNIKDKAIDGFESYYRDNKFEFLAKGKIIDNKVVFDGESLDKNDRKAVIPLINDFMTNTIYENQIRYIPYSSTEYDEDEFQRMQIEGDVEIQYVEDDNEYGKVRGVNIITPKYKTAKLQSFNIGVTQDKFENSPHFYHPEKLVFLYGFLPSIVLMTVLFLLYDSFSDFDKYKKIPIVVAFRKTPIEIKIILWVSMLASSALGLTYPIDLVDDIFAKFDYMVTITFMVLFSIIVIAIERSIILEIKLIYRYGFKSSFLENSLIVKLIKNILEFSKKLSIKVKKWIIKALGDLGEISLFKISIIVGAFLIIMMISHYAGFETLVVPVMAYIIGRMVYTFSKNMEKVNRQSSMIAKGDYEVNVDEEIPYFKTIAKNFNTIGDNINKSVEEKVKAERLKTDLIANVSHDLKTPLTSIISYSSLLKEPDTTDEMKDEYVEVIYEKATKLNNLIEDLFQISKISSNSIEFHREKINIVDFINQVVGEFRDNLEDNNMKVILNAPEYPIYCNLDGQKTYRVFENLITNIVKYAQENTRVYLTLEDGGDKVRITLKNISKYELDISPKELQERFIRADKSRNTEGNGLGLSIASSFVEGQGGTFNMEIDGDLFKTIIIFKKYDENHLE